jgi:L-erythro-3,5-diaminohexanoate dehydrogenase
MMRAAPQRLRRLGHPFGVHRVVEPVGSLPQSAWKLDNDVSRLYSNEILIDVEWLNIDSSSFRQMQEHGRQSGRDVGQVVLDTIRQRGKQHNPITGSGGMLLGTVAAMGEALGDRWEGFQVGDRVATLVSLSLTPLTVESVLNMIPSAAQLHVQGGAVLFESGSMVKLPADFPESVALAVLDVCGAPMQVSRLVHPGSSVVVLGAGGKSGLLCVAEACRRMGRPGVGIPPDAANAGVRVGGAGRLVGVESNPAAAAELRALGWCDEVVELDATAPVAVYDAALRANGGRLYDVAISCVNAPGAEMSAILPVRDHGTVYFFSMATSFTAAALGAEGVSKDVQLMIGNGYAEGHAAHALDLVRNCQELYTVFMNRYSSKHS